MPRRKRLEKTAEIMARSLARPVSFSTMLARISACSGVFKGESGVRALQAASAAGIPPDEAFVRAARAARAGVRATIPMVARRGLALRLGERSRGHRDPGATSCFLLIRSMLDGRTRRRPPVRPQ